jgi:tripartite-type tricarboxylate transporter receptor subunit TctC
MLTQYDYDRMWDAFQAGKITEEEWREFCSKYLEQIMSDPKIIAMMKRLTND